MPGPSLHRRSLKWSKEAFYVLYPMPYKINIIRVRVLLEIPFFTNEINSRIPKKLSYEFQMLTYFLKQVLIKLVRLNLSFSRMKLWLIQKTFRKSFSAQTTQTFVYFNHSNLKLCNYCITLTCLKAIR